MKNEVEKSAPRSDVRVGQKPAEVEGRAERVALLRDGLAPPTPYDAVAHRFKAMQCINIAKKEGLEGTDPIEHRALELMDWSDDGLDKYSELLDAEIEEDEAKLSKRGVVFHDTPTRGEVALASLSVDIAEAEGLDKDEVLKEEPWINPFIERVNELMKLSFDALLTLRQEKLAELEARTKRLEETQDVMTDAIAMLFNLTKVMKEAKGISEEEAIDKTGYWGADEP